MTVAVNGCEAVADCQLALSGNIIGCVNVSYIMVNVWLLSVILLLNVIILALY